MVLAPGWKRAAAATALAACIAAAASAQQPWTDDPVVAGQTPIRAVHLQEIIQRIDALRAGRGLPEATYADRPRPRGGVRADVISGAISALAAVYRADGLAPPTYGRVASGEPIRAATLNALRAAIVDRERLPPARPSTVAGRIIDARHEQVVLWNARVELGDRHVITRRDGRYRFDRVSGPVTLAVDAGGYVGQSRQVFVQRDLDLDFVLQREGTAFPEGSGAMSLTFIDNDGTTLFDGITDAGQAQADCPASRPGTVHRFDVRFIDGRSSFVDVDPELGDHAEAMRHATGMGRALGRVPTVLRAGVQSVCLHNDGTEAANFAYPAAGRIYYYLPGRDANDLAPITLHEGTHVALDPHHRHTPEWRAAVGADGNHISDYGTGSEDLAESFPAWFLVRYNPEHIADWAKRAVLLTIPNRLAYLEAQGFDMSPYAPTGSLMVTPGPIYAKRRGDPQPF